MGICVKPVERYTTNRNETYLYIAKKCGQDFVEERYFYNLIEYRGNVVETRSTNFFGGYDYVKTTLTKNIERVKIKKKFFGWELFDTIKEA